MKQKIKWVWLMFIALVTTGCAISTPSQIAANNLVDELCSKDGGVKVYETVKLSKDSFNKYFGSNGRAILDKNYAEPNDDYYTITEHKYIENSLGLSINQYRTSLYRRSDQKVLGEFIRYSRIRSDPSAFLELTPHSCVESPENDLTTKVFLKSN